jgi:hypothetical protein
MLRSEHTKPVGHEGNNMIRGTSARAATPDTDVQHKNGKITGTGKGRPPVETRFRPGNGGRKKGSKNRATVFLDAMNDGDVDAIVKAVIDKAKKGDLAACKLVLDRVMPVPRSRPVSIALRAIGEYDGADAMLAAHRAIVEAVTDGNVSPAEGLELVGVIEAQRAAVETLRPARMDAKPKPLTPEEQRQKEAQDEALSRICDLAGSMTGIPSIRPRR